MRLKNKSIYALMLSIMMASQNLMIPVSAEENLQEVTISKDDELLSETITSDSEKIEQNQEEIKVDDEKIYQPDPQENKKYSFGGGEYLSRTSSNLDIKSTTLSQNAIGSGVITAESLNIRSGPSTSYSKLGTLKNGDSIQIYARSNGWYRIYYNGQYAYVSSSYVNLNVIEKGIDVSKWNGTIDWNKVKNSGIDYAIIRAGYGTSTVDPMFHTNIKGAIDAGLKVGVYWFSYATSSEKAKIEAQKCLETISPYKKNITYPVFYDFEYESVDYAIKQGVTITKDLASEMANTFVNYTKSQGYDSGIYTNLDFSNKYFTTDLLHNNNMWIAQYRSECTFAKPYMMWQYTESGKVDGINGKVDLNYTCLKSMTHDYNGNDIPKVDSPKNVQVQKVYNVKVNSRTSSSLNLSWSKVDGATGYIVQRYDSSSNTYKTIVTQSGESNTSYNVKNLNGGTTYKYKVKAYKIVNNKTYYGPASNELKAITNPYSAKNLKVDWTSTKSVKLSWSKEVNADGYKVYRYNSATNTYTNIATINGNYNISYIDTDLYTANAYKYKVKAYVKLDGVEFMGGDSNISTAITKPSTPVINLKSYTGKIGIVWSNIQKATGYKLYMSTSKNGNYSLVNTTSSTTYTKTGLVSGKTYYFKVVAYKTIGGQTVYSADSTIKSIKCK